MKITRKMVDEVLVRGLELVSKKNGWMQGNFANKSEALSASCFCALGACVRASVELTQTLGKSIHRNVRFDDINGLSHREDHTNENFAAITFATDLYGCACDRLGGLP